MYAVRSSILIISFILENQSDVGGGDVCFQKAGMHALAALSMWQVRLFLYSRVGVEFRWNRKLSGFLVSGALVMAEMVDWTRSQKVLSLVHDQKVCSRVPGSDPHLQHVDGVLGNILFKVVGTLYHLDNSLNPPSCILVHIEDLWISSSMRDLCVGDRLVWRSSSHLEKYCGICSGGRWSKSLYIRDKECLTGLVPVHKDSNELRGLGLRECGRSECMKWRSCRLCQKLGVGRLYAELSLSRSFQVGSVRKCVSLE